MNDLTGFQKLSVIGIDLGKRNFHVYGCTVPDRPNINRQLSRKQLRAFLTKLPPSLIAMEACASAHYWGRYSIDAGHQVRLIAPQFVKPYVKSNKNDSIDAQAIWEASQRPTMRFVAAKSIE